MRLNILHTLLHNGTIALHIAHITRLQVVVGSTDAISAHGSHAIKQALQFVASIYSKGSTSAIRFFGRYRHPVYPRRNGTSAIGFHRYLIAMLMQTGSKSLIHLQGWFATRKHHKTCRILQDGLHNLLITHLTVCFKRGVAERATQIAARKAHKYGCPACMEALAL